MTVMELAVAVDIFAEKDGELTLQAFQARLAKAEAEACSRFGDAAMEGELLSEEED